MSPRILTQAAFSLAFSLALAACQSTGGGCPPLVAYSLEEQKNAAKQLRTLPKNSPLAAMIVDYKKTRDACRAGGAPEPAQ
ncbi:hypothetical protein HUN39_04695 [Methylocystis sp. FS]|uniref:hypothetical protein n=1 Tax=Methylocystis silviterrae TaxID=2743612 RepID=UPI0015835218|nr:hypothetical protein [Methylocystis silviterrae]NUJ79337.1 hypothetical protein [Methylocystis silviterrae]